MKITIVGTGRLGLAVGLCFARAGNDVLGVDSNEQYVESLSDKTFHSEEPSIDEYLSTTKMKFTTSLKEGYDHGECIFVYVPTTDGKEYTHDLIEKVIKELYGFEIYDTGKLFVIGSTIIPGSFLKKWNSLNLFYSPEFIAQGSIIRDFLYPDMILIGSNDDLLTPRLEQVYGTLYPGGDIPPFRHMSILEASLCKLALNGYVTTKIAYANMIGDLAKRMNCDPDKVLSAIGMDSRIGNKAFRYGYSFGGPCFPKDVESLNDLLKLHDIPSFIEDMINTNKSHIIFQLIELFNENRDEYIFERVAYKDTKVPIIENSTKLKIALLLSRAGKRIIIRDTPSIINEIKKKHGDIFQYEIV